MGFGAELNTVFFIVLSVGLGVAGLIWEELNELVDGPYAPSDGTDKESPGENVSVNLAILYATIALLIASVVSRWPPEGQDFQPWVTTAVLFISVAAAAFIAGRVVRLIHKVESPNSKQHDRH